MWKKSLFLIQKPIFHPYSRSLTLLKFWYTSGTLKIGYPETYWNPKLATQKSIGTQSWLPRVVLVPKTGYSEKYRYLKLADQKIGTQNWLPQKVSVPKNGLPEKYWCQKNG